MKTTLFLSLVAASLLVGCGSGTTTDKTASSPSANATGGTPAGSKKTIAFVTNNVSDFWTIAQKGTEKAQAELPNYTIEFKMPSEGTAASQKQILDDLATNGTAGIAVSPVNAADQTPDLDQLSTKALLFTQDSDAPNSKRACYLGTDNVAAGFMAGEELKKACPGGGKVMVFVGKSDAQNAKERFEGLKKALDGSKLSIIDLRTDDTDRARAKQNVADTLTAYPDVAACVGLWSYNGPAIASAIKEAKKEGKVQIVCFDEEDETLAGVKDKVIFATIVQQPFEFGYQSMKLMAKVLDGDKSAIPESKKIIIPTQVVNAANVEAYAAKLKTLKGK